MKLKVKVIVGYRRDQEHSIDADEAHKAYFLFLHPEGRTVFKDGLALRGDQIQEIIPDYQGTMGWNSTHQLDSDDWSELHRYGVPGRLRNILQAAKDVAYGIKNPSDLNLPLSELQVKLLV